jgi:AcrR family transcriptional regulator
MGRRRRHDESTATSLLDAAEKTIARDGVDALSLRDVASDAGTTTRAVYTLFGSKEALLGELGSRAFGLLGEEIAALPTTDRPADDLIEVALVFRRFATGHPALFSVVFHRADPAVWPRFRDAAGDALEELHKRFKPLQDDGLLGDRDVWEAAAQFRALAEGIAWFELRGTPFTHDPETFWRSAFQALIAGFAASA